MTFSSQGMIDGLDKKTVNGFAEALLIAVSSCKDDQGRWMAVRFHDDASENIKIALQVAEMMLGGKNDAH
jgi:hypothetical protein